jgi:regulator of CtrA degradation
MSDKGANAAELVAFGEVLAASQAFSAYFREGMALVEETAAYLDGPGRQDAKKLERAAALAYATESMRLTTRLMQLASWLLLHRAVNEGEMSLAQASREKKKVKLVPSATIEEATLRMLPARLRDLIERSSRLLDKVRRLDATIHAQPSVETGPSAVRHQLTQLRAAFEHS